MAGALALQQPGLAMGDFLDGRAVQAVEPRNFGPLAGDFALGFALAQLAYAQEGFESELKASGHTSCSRYFFLPAKVCRVLSSSAPSWQTLLVASSNVQHASCVCVRNAFTASRVCTATS